jgi:PDZ domain-containing protein
MMHVGEYVADMVALERQLVAFLSDRIRDAEDHPHAASELRRIEQMAQENLMLLRTRLSTLSVAEKAEPELIAALPASRDMSYTPHHGVARALHVCFTALNHMTFGYAMLHAVAHRFYDSQGEGNTADLAEEHLRRYTAAAQEIQRLICDVVVAELDAAGSECLCQCPSRGLGICLCAPHGTATVDKAWRETTAAPPGPGIEVRTPRSGSPAAQAGLCKGDRVVAADGQQLPTDLDITILQTAVRGRQSGQSVLLDVLRQNGDHSQVTVTPP